MYRLVQNDDVIGTVEHAHHVDLRIGELYKSGVITTLIGVDIHPDDVAIAKKEMIQHRIDTALNEMGLTVREQRVVIANGTLLALMGVSRVMTYINTPDNKDNNDAIADWATIADKFIDIYSNPELLLNVLSESDIVDKILHYAITTGGTITDVQNITASELLKEV